MFHSAGTTQPLFLSRCLYLSLALILRDLTPYIQLGALHDFFSHAKIYLDLDHLNMCHIVNMP